MGLFGALLNAFLTEDAFEIVMNLAGIGIAGTWAAILVIHLAYLRKVRAGLEVCPTYRIPWAPYSNYPALAFFIVVGSNITSPPGLWTLGLFAVVLAMMVGGWYAVRNSIRSDLLDNIVEAE